MGCAPSKLLRRRRRQIGLREEVPDLPSKFKNIASENYKNQAVCSLWFVVLLLLLNYLRYRCNVHNSVPTQADPWVISGNYLHHDISAFISPAQVTMLPPENPPPYSEELQDGHITLMRGTQIFKDTVDESCVNSGAGGAEQCEDSMVTAGDVTIMSNTSDENAANMAAMLLDREAMNEGFQHAEETTIDDASNNEGNGAEPTALPQMDIDSTQADIYRETNNHNAEIVNEEVTRHSAVVPPNYIHFYRPLHHRSLSVDHSSLLDNNDQLRVPNPRPSQSMSLPTPLSTPFPPKVTLPPITRAPKNISPILTEGWVPNEQFARRPSRLPPLRKRNRVATWHGENSIVVPSVSPINSVQE